MRAHQMEPMVVESFLGLHYVMGAALLIGCANRLLPEIMSPYVAGIANRVHLIGLEIAEQRFMIPRNSLGAYSISIILSYPTALLVSALDPKLQSICFVAIIIFDLSVLSSRFR